MNLFAFVAPGPWEILWVILVGLLYLGVFAAIVVLVVVLWMWRKGRGGGAANPNLFPCPDCRRFVSRQAPNCPHCGRPLTGAVQP